MNKVDQVVSNMMLTYPLLYSTRAEVLHSIFLGTNYVWKDGNLRPVFRDEKVYDLIDTRDLDDSDKQWAGDDDFAVGIRLRNELERMNRIFRATHIKHFAKMKGGDYGYAQLDYWYLDRSSGNVLTDAPFGSIDPEWLAAIEEFLSNMFVAFNQVFNLHYDHDTTRALPEPSMFSRMPEVFQNRYLMLKEIEAKCEAQSGTKENAKAFWESHGKKVLAEIVEEENS